LRSHDKDDDDDYRNMRPDDGYDDDGNMIPDDGYYSDGHMGHDDGYDDDRYDRFWKEYMETIGREKKARETASQPDGTKMTATVSHDKVVLTPKSPPRQVALPASPSPHKPGQKVEPKYVPGVNVPSDFTGFPENYDEDAIKRYLDVYSRSRYSNIKHDSVIRAVRKERKDAGNPLRKLPKGRPKKT